MSNKPSKKSNMEKSNIPWVEKYRPKSIKEMALPTAKVSGHRVKLAEELIEFVKKFFIEIKKINQANKGIRAHNRKASNKEQKELLKLPTEQAAILLEGPPGIGKTSIVYALANDLNMDVVETNASDTRTKDALESKLKETMKSRGIMDFVVPRQKLILVDEVDGIHGNKDRGAVPSIIALIQATQFPIIMCSNKYKQNLKSLYRVIQRFEVHPLSESEVMKIAQNILKKEEISIKPDDVKLIINKNHGDLRGVINDLQGIGQGSSDVDNKELILSLRRDSTEEIFNLIRILFQEVTSLQGARDLTNKSEVDYNFLYKWIHENLPSFIRNSEDLARAYENLSLADEIFGRIRKNMYWGLLPYFFDLFAGGVVLSQRRRGAPSQGFRRIKNPRFIRTGSLTVAEKSLVDKINKQYAISQFEVIQDFLPFLRTLCNSSRRQLKNVSDWLELDAKEKKLLKI